MRAERASLHAATARPVVGGWRAAAWMFSELGLVRPENRDQPPF